MKQRGWPVGRRRRAAKEALPTAFAGAEDGPDLDFIRSLVDYLVERAV